MSNKRSETGSTRISRFWWLVLFFWLVVTIAVSLENLLLHAATPDRLLWEAIFHLSTWFFMTLLVMWISSIYTLDHAHWKRTIWVYLMGCVVSLGFVALLSYFASPPRLATASGGSHSMAVSILLRLTYQLPTYWGLVAVAHVVRLYERDNLRKLREFELQTRLAHSRLQALHSQLNPHFLFNTLNSIASLLHDDPGKAEKMIEALGDLLRLAINSHDRQQVTLREELHFLDQYLFLLRIRFGHRLQVEITTDKTVLDEMVPALILQPLVENAIKHGTETLAAAGRIRIAANARDGDPAWCLEVSNDGMPSKVNGNTIKERVGLTNTRARLEAMFGSSARLQLHSRPEGGFVVQILIPRRSVRLIRTQFEPQYAS